MEEFDWLKGFEAIASKDHLFALASSDQRKTGARIRNLEDSAMLTGEIRNQVNQIWNALPTISMTLSASLPGFPAPTVTAASRLS